jgi:protein-disulfide isomerase
MADRWRTVLGFAAILTLGASAVDAQPTPGAKSPTPAAKVGEEVISLEDVEQAVRPQLAKIEEQRHTIIEDKLDQLIGDRLLAQEAKRRGIPVEQLLKAEVYAKVPEVTDEQVNQFISQNRSRLPQGEEGELKLKVWDFLRSQKVNERRLAYIQALRTQSKVTVYLEAPAAARMPVSGSRGFARGAKDAPITIVEFSDFQCPFCKSVIATVKQVMDKYPGKVRWVFRDFPIPVLHPAAVKAHEAARCAAEQGKFWEYHDLLFDKTSRQTPEELKQYAKDLKLDSASFGQCLDSGRQEAAVNRDVEDGTRLGVTGTPTFFINGRQLVGAQPLTTFQRVIDSELTRKPTP